MKLKKLKPITNSSRHVKRIQKNLLAKTNRLIRGIIQKKNPGAGRSSINGRITVRHKGNGAKRLYRIIKDSKNSECLAFLIISTCYDPNRDSFINLNFDIIRKNFFYTNASHGTIPGQICRNYNDQVGSFNVGDRIKIGKLTSGVLIHNLTSDFSYKSTYIKAAGTSGQIIQSESNLIKIRLPSGKYVEIKPDNFATIGRVTNMANKLQCLGKAGTRRLMGIRPSVRGIAMNPVDHPHGGRTNGGTPSMTPWGLKCKAGYYLKKRKKVSR